MHFAQIFFKFILKELSFVNSFVILQTQNFLVSRFIYIHHNSPTLFA